MFFYGLCMFICHVGTLIAITITLLAYVKHTIFYVEM